MINITTDKNDEKGFKLSVKGPNGVIATQALSIALTMGSLYMEATGNDFATFIQMLMANKNDMTDVNPGKELFENAKENEDHSVKKEVADAFKEFICANMSGSKESKKDAADNLKKAMLKDFFDKIYGESSDDMLNECLKKMLGESEDES